MKKIQQVSLALLTTISILIYSCGPTDDKGGMDEKNSDGEGAVDSSRLPNLDSTHASDSSHASLSNPYFIIPSTNNKINSHALIENLR